MWLIVPVIHRVTDGHWISFVSEMAHYSYSAPKYRPSSHTHCFRQPCRGWMHLWKPPFGLVVKPFCRVLLNFVYGWKTMTFSALFTETVLTYAVFTRTWLRREISPAVFSRVQLGREYIQNQPPLPQPLESWGNFLHPSLVSVIHPLTELLCFPSATWLRSQGFES